MRSLLGAAAYAIFFVPMFIDREDPLLCYHARQGLGLAMLWIVAWLMHRVCVAMGLGIFSWIGYAGCLVLMVVGIYRALGREERPLPYFGDWFARIPLWRRDERDAD